MGKTFDLRGLWRRSRQDETGEPVHAAERDADAKPRSVDVELIIQAARLAVTTRAASKTLFIRQLYVTGDVAEKLLVRLEHCKVIAPLEPGKQRRVVTTSAQLPAVIADFERRG